MKIYFFVDGQQHTWNIHADSYPVKEDQQVYFELCDLQNDEIPLLFIEDYELDLTADYTQDSGRIFRSVSTCLFRESFGLTLINIHLAEQRFELRFEVSVKKSTARQVEGMIRYIAHKQDDILRICLSPTTLSNDIADPETLLNTVDTFINTLTGCRLELQNHLRKRLIPVKQPAWKSSKSSDIDPFDIIFNLDVLEPVLGEGDVVVNGRSFSITETEITTLESTANVKENAILLGGLYSMRRIVADLLNDINTGFPDKTTTHNHEYESLSNVLLRITSANMPQRCEQQLLQLEEFIRYFEKIIGVHYQGECHPVMTPFVRASRVYRRLFEQLYDWYTLGDPSLEGRNYLVKLRSISKIYEFVTLFKLIDYLHEKNWVVINTHWSDDLEFIPSTVTFERNNFKLTLNYEARIVPYHSNTKHLDLVDMKHSATGEYDYWCPDFILRLDGMNKSVYLILDAKYSSSTTVKLLHLPALLNKYFMNIAVYDAYHHLLKQDAILGIIALFPDKNSALPIYLPNWGKYNINRKPVRLPVVMGLPILPQLDNLAYQTFDKILEIAQQQLHQNSG